MPSSHVEKPATLWPPPRTAIGRSLLRAKPTAAITSAAPAQRTISAGRRPSYTPFQTRHASVVALVSRREDLAAHGFAQLLDGRFPEHRADRLAHLLPPSG